MEDSDVEDEEEKKAKEEVTGGEDVKGIPEFWLTALKNHVPTAETISDRDEEALKHLVDVRLSYLDGEKPGFKLHFVFTANEFFEDAELTKTYYYQVSIGMVKDPRKMLIYWFRNKLATVVTLSMIRLSVLRSSGRKRRTSPRRSKSRSRGTRVRLPCMHRAAHG